MAVVDMCLADVLHEFPQILEITSSSICSLQNTLGKKNASSPSSHQGTRDNGPGGCMSNSKRCRPVTSSWAVEPFWMFLGLAMAFGVSENEFFVNAWIP